MLWWARNRRIGRIAAAIVVAILVSALLGNVVIPLPSLRTTGGVAVPLVMVLPLLPVAALVGGFASAPRHAELLGIRRVALLDVALCVGAAVLTLTASLAVVTGGGGSAGVALARNLIGYLGLGLIGLCCLGPHAATALPTGYVLTAGLFGMHAGRQPDPWAWPGYAATHAPAFGVAVATFFLGAGLFLLTNHSTAVRD
jgi:hypothetical protein